MQNLLYWATYCSFTLLLAIILTLFCALYSNRKWKSLAAPRRPYDPLDIFNRRRRGLEFIACLIFIYLGLLPFTFWALSYFLQLRPESSLHLERFHSISWIRECCYWLLFITTNLIGSFFLDLFLATRIRPPLAQIRGPIDEITKWSVPARIAVLLACFLTIPSLYHLLGLGFGYFPSAPVRPIPPSPQVERELRELQAHAESLQVKLANPEKLTLFEVESLAQDAVTFSKQLAQMSHSHQVLISNLASEVKFEKERAESEKERAEKASMAAQQLQSLADKQIDAVKSVLTSDANVSSESAFKRGVFWSFPIGCITSLIASWIYGRVAKSRSP